MTFKAYQLIVITELAGDYDQTACKYASTLTVIVSDGEKLTTVSPVFCLARAWDFGRPWKAAGAPTPCVGGGWCVVRPNATPVGVTANGIWISSSCDVPWLEPSHMTKNQMYEVSLARICMPCLPAACDALAGWTNVDLLSGCLPGDLSPIVLSTLLGGGLPMGEFMPGEYFMCGLGDLPGLFGEGVFSMGAGSLGGTCSLPSSDTPLTSSRFLRLRSNFFCIIICRSDKCGGKSLTLNLFMSYKYHADTVFNTPWKPCRALQAGGHLTSYSLLLYSSTVSCTSSLRGGTTSLPITFSSAGLWNLANKQDRWAREHFSLSAIRASITFIAFKYDMAIPSDIRMLQRLFCCESLVWIELQ